MSRSLIMTAFSGTNYGKTLNMIKMKGLFLDVVKMRLGSSIY